MKTLIRVAYGASCDFAGIALLLYLAGFVTNIGVPKTIDTGLRAPIPAALANNTLLIVILFLHYSAMAQPWFRGWSSRVPHFPHTLERSTNVLFASLPLVLLIWLWQPLPTIIWDAQSAPARFVLLALGVAGWITVLLFAILIRHAEFFNIKREFMQFPSVGFRNMRFLPSSAYRFAAHLETAGVLVAIWMTPTMTVGHLWFSLGISMYLFLAAISSNAEKACGLAAALHAMGRPDEAREFLVDVIFRNPGHVGAQSQLARILKMDARLVSEEAKRENAERRALIEAARASLENDPFFTPSRFWDQICAKHEQLLDQLGINNFKRSVAHQYQNWLIHSSKDIQWRRLLEIWKANRTWQPVLNTVEGADDAGWNVDPPFYPLSSPSSMAIYKLAVGILWEHALAKDHFGFLKHFEESTIGNPIRIRRNGSLISQDAAHSAREFNTLFHRARITRDQSLTFAELGAGHGRLAEMIGRFTNSRYLIFDIPPALAVSQWYVQQLFPNERTFQFREFSSWDDIEDEVDSCRFAFFTPNQIKSFPHKSVDVFINFCSLMEMRREQISWFLDRIGQMTRHSFMSKQYYTWKNIADGIVVTKGDFAMKRDFDLVYDQPDEINKDLFVQLWTRRGRS